MTGLLSAMPTDILLLCVVVFVTSASTFCCQIFGRMCAKRLLAAKATETDSGERHASRPVRRRRDHVSSSMRSLSSLESLDYASSVTSEGRISRRRWRIRKRRHSRPTRHSDHHPRPRSHRLEPQAKRAWRQRKPMNIRPRDRRLSRGLSGTFGRLGIPKEQVLPQELKLVMNRLEDKNLSPMLDTGADYFLPKGSRHAPRNAARRPPLRPFRMIYSRNPKAQNSLKSESDLSLSKSEEAFQREADQTPDPLNNIKQDLRKGKGFPHERSLYDRQSPRGEVS